MSDQSSGSSPLRIVMKAALNIALVYAMDRYLPQYFSVFGGWAAFVVIGALITLLNFVLRPVLDLLTLPLKLFATVFAAIVVNGAFLWLVYQITLRMDPGLIAMTVTGGLTGWLVLSVVLGTGNWMIRHIVK
jgi:uncharacterized membrane protein YvlD (DUF360 family)